MITLVGLFIPLEQDFNWWENCQEATTVKSIDNARQYNSAGGLPKDGCS